ncbi:MAG: MCE family protein [Planctomycetales bacterium]|nr:MCE family protein [Planctomycetales bacterium]
MNEPYRLRYTNQIVGVFLLIVLIITTAVSVLLFSRLLVTRDHFYVTATEEEASGLRSGTEVLMLGQSVGLVDELRYFPDSDLVRVRLAIDSDFEEQITSDSEVTLNRKFGVGTPVLTIRRRKSNDRQGKPIPLEPGQSIGRFRGEVDAVDKMSSDIETASSAIDLAGNSIATTMTDSIDPAFRQGEAAFQSFEKTSESLRGEVTATLAEIRRTTASLEKEMQGLSQRVNHLIDSDIRSAVVRVQESAVAATDAARSVEKTAETIESKSEMTNEDVAKTLATLRETSLLIQKLTNESREVVRIVRSEAEELPGTTARVNDTISDTQELVGDINDHWLLRRYRNEAGPTKQLSPSSVRGGSVR